MFLTFSVWQNNHFLKSATHAGLKTPFKSAPYFRAAKERRPASEVHQPRGHSLVPAARVAPGRAVLQQGHRHVGRRLYHGGALDARAHPQRYPFGQVGPLNPLLLIKAKGFDRHFYGEF